MTVDYQAPFQIRQCRRRCTAARRGFALSLPEHLPYGAIPRDADVRTEVDQQRSVVGHMIGKSHHARESGEWESAEPTEPERPEHLVGSLGVLDGVDVIAANAVG